MAWTRKYNPETNQWEDVWEADAATTTTENNKDTGWEKSKTAATVDRAFLRQMYTDYLGRSPSIAELNAWEDWGAKEENADHFNQDDFIPVFKAASAEELAATGGESTAPTYEFEMTDEMKNIENILASKIVKEPELTPEMVSKWQDFVLTAQEPATGKAVTKLREEYNLSNPYGIGSGSQFAATQEMLANIAANNAAQALSLGQTEYANKLAGYNTALEKYTALQGYKEAGKKATTEAEAANYWTNLKRQWDLTDASTERDYYKEIAEMYQPDENQWWKDVLGTGAQVYGAVTANPWVYAAGSGLKGDTSTDYYKKYMKS